MQNQITEFAGPVHHLKIKRNPNPRSIVFIVVVPRSNTVPKFPRDPPQKLFLIFISSIEAKQDKQINKDMLVFKGCIPGIATQRARSDVADLRFASPP